MALAAALPLVGLVVLQYHWMRQLERTSAIVGEATLDNYLEAITSDVEVYYRTEAERALNLPAALFTNGTVEKAAYYFKKKGVAGARRLFVVPLTGDKMGLVHYYDPAKVAFYEPEWGPEARAVYVAAASWKTLAHKGGTVEYPTLAVDERDPDHRMLLNPITDETSHLVGLAGMIVDAGHFQNHVLPAAVKKSLPGFFPGGPDKAPVVTLHDSRGRKTCFGASRPAGQDDVSGPFTFVFTDFKIGLKSRHATPASWARHNFGMNLAFSGLLALAVVGGLGFAVRAAAREMKLSQMKSEFVSNVSHELRTPLASIRVFGELLRLGRVERPEKVREYGEYIETESRRLTQLINNILDFSRIESGRKDYRFERGRSRGGGGRDAAHLPPQPAAGRLPPGVLPPGRGRCRRSRSTPRRSRRRSATCSTTRSSTPARRATSRSACAATAPWAVVWVRDHGIGIPRDEQQKIFDRFHRVPTGLVHDVKGSGLGLAIVRHIVEAHRGRVEVESEPGEGSTFSLYLPLERPRSRSCRIGAASARRRREPQMNQKQVLIVEDDEAMSVALRDGFAYEGYAVEMARDGEEGLRLAAAQAARPDDPRRDAAQDDRARRLQAAARRRAARCRSSCSPRAARRSTRCWGSRSAPTTTSPSRSASWS